MAEKPFDIKKTVTRLKTVGGAVMHVTAAAPRRDKLVRCVLKYRKKGAEEAKEYELETVGDHTTWEKLSERVIAALWPNRRDTQNTVAMLEFAPLAPPGAEVEVVYILDTPTLMRALQAFRDTYELRKSAAIDKIIAEVEGLMRSGDPEAIARGARMIQALMQTSLDPETHAKLLGLLTEGLEKQKDHENGARDALELAAVAFVKTGVKTHRTKDLMFGKNPMNVIHALLGRFGKKHDDKDRPWSQKDDGEPGDEVELSTNSVCALAAVANDKSGAYNLLKPDSLISILKKMLDEKDDDLAGKCAGALCTAVVRHPGAVETWGLTGHVVQLLSKLMRSSKSWEVRRCAATMLGAAARKLRRIVADYAKKGLPVDERSHFTIPSLVSNDADSEDGSDYDDVAEEDEEDEDFNAFLKANPKTPKIDIPVKCSTHWAELLRQPEVFLSALTCMKAATEVLLPDCTTLGVVQRHADDDSLSQLGGGPSEPERRKITVLETSVDDTVSAIDEMARRNRVGGTARASRVSPDRSPKGTRRSTRRAPNPGKTPDEVRSSMSNIRASARATQRTTASMRKSRATGRVLSTSRGLGKQNLRNSGTRRTTVRQTVAKGTVSNMTVESTVELSGFLLWAVAATLRGDEAWVKMSTVRALLALTLYPLSPPAIRCATLHSCAALERLCIHKTFARLIAKQAGIVDVLRMLLERDALPNVQCWALRILQAVLEASKHVRDVLVIDNFRTVLANRMLERKGALKAEFVTLGAHMLATITKLSMELVEKQKRHADEGGPSAERRKTLVRSTVVGISRYMKTIITLLEEGPPASLRFTAIHVWLLARAPEMRENLVRNNVVAALIPRLEAIVQIICPRKRSAITNERQSRINARFESEMDDVGRVQTLNQLAATTWVLLQSHTARVACKRTGCINIIVQHIVELHASMFSTARRLLLCCLWQLSHYDASLQNLLIDAPVSRFYMPAKPESDSEDDDSDASDGLKRADDIEWSDTSSDDDEDEYDDDDDSEAASKSSRATTPASAAASPKAKARSLETHQAHRAQQRRASTAALGAAVGAGGDMAKNPKKAEDEAKAALRRSAVFVKVEDHTLTFRELLGQVGSQDDQALEVRLVACRFYYYLVEAQRLTVAKAQVKRLTAVEGVDQAQVQAAVAKDESDKDVAANLALILLQTTGPAAKEAHMHGALLLAKEARTATKKLSLAEAGAIEKLINALRRADPESTRAITCILHAIFNISTHPSNQVRTIKHGLKVILKHARGSPAGVRATAFATRTLENCRHNAETVSAYYKVELRYKARLLRRRAEVKDGGGAASLAPTARTPSLATLSVDDRGADGGSLSVASPNGHSKKTEDSKLQRFKCRFESFLKDFETYAEAKKPRSPSPEAAPEDDEDVDFWLKGKKRKDDRSVATESLVDTPPPKPVYKHTRLRTLGKEMSKSVMDIWVDKRPPSGQTSTPNFCPRTTWSPRITSTAPVPKKIVLERLAEESAASSNPTAPTAGPNRGVKFAGAGPAVPPLARTPNRDVGLSPFGTPRSAVAAPPDGRRGTGRDESSKSAREDDAAAERRRRSLLGAGAPPAQPEGGALSDLDQRLALRPAPPSSGRRKPPPVRVFMEGGKRFTFHRPVDEILAEDVDASDEEKEPPMCAQFPRVEGSRISEGLFERYALPDGTESHFYFRNRNHSHFNEDTDPRPIPPTDDLKSVLGNAHIPYGPAAPALDDAAWPPLYTPLNKAADELNKYIYGDAGGDDGADDLRHHPGLNALGLGDGKHGAGKGGGESFEDPMVLVLKPEHVREVDKAEDTGPKLGPNGELLCPDGKPLGWNIASSAIWRPRGPEMSPPYSPRDYYHNKKFYRRSATHDWNEMMGRSRFVNVVKRLVGEQNLEAELAAMKKVLTENFRLTSNVFHFFAAMYGSSNEHQLGENGFKECIDSCGIPDRKNKACNTTTVDHIFIEANVDDPVSAADKRNTTKSMPAEAKNSTNLIVRFEFHQALILLSIAKYIHGGEETRPSAAFEKLIKEQVANAKEKEPLSTHDPDDFRRHALYNEDVEQAIMPHMSMLREMYKTFTTVSAIKKKMSVRDWIRLMVDVSFFDEDFTRCEGKLAFVWSQMKTADTTKHAADFTTLSFTDFLEALCRVAVAKTWPSDDVLDATQFDVETALAYFDNCESYNDDPKKAMYMDEPGEYEDWDDHNVAMKIKKLFLTIYRRLAKIMQSNSAFLSRCVRPGIQRALIQLGLSSAQRAVGGGRGAVMMGGAPPRSPGQGLRDSQAVARGAPSFRPGTASSAASGSNASYSRPGTPSRPPTAPVPEDAPAADDRPLSGAEAGLLSNMIGKGAFGK